MNEREQSVKSPLFHGLFLLLTCTDMRLTRGPLFLIYANNTSIPLPTFIGYLSCTRHYEASLNPHDNPVTQTLVPSLLVRKHSLRKGGAWAKATRWEEAEPGFAPAGGMQGPLLSLSQKPYLPFGATSRLGLLRTRSCTRVFSLYFLISPWWAAGPVRWEACAPSLHST